jgi:hypothetical protein
MANSQSSFNPHAPAALSVRDHQAILARLNKHDRELGALQSLLVVASAALPWIVEAQELRASGYTYGQIAQRLDITRDIVSAVLSAEEDAQ